MSVNSVSEAVVIDLPGDLIDHPNGRAYQRVLMHPHNARKLLEDLKEHFDDDE